MAAKLFLARDDNGDVVARIAVQQAETLRRIERVEVEGRQEEVSRKNIGLKEKTDEEMLAEARAFVGANYGDYEVEPE